MSDATDNTLAKLPLFSKAEFIAGGQPLRDHVVSFDTAQVGLAASKRRGLHQHLEPGLAAYLKATLCMAVPGSVMTDGTTRFQPINELSDAVVRNAIQKTGGASAGRTMSQIIADIKTRKIENLPPAAYEDDAVASAYIKGTISEMFSILLAVPDGAAEYDVSMAVRAVTQRLGGLHMAFVEDLLKTWRERPGQEAHTYLALAKDAYSNWNAHADVVIPSVRGAVRAGWRERKKKDSVDPGGKEESGPPAKKQREWRDKRKAQEPGGGSSSDKRTRGESQEKRDNATTTPKPESGSGRPCGQWTRKGKCSYGDRCKYLHGAVVAGNESSASGKSKKSSSYADPESATLAVALDEQNSQQGRPIIATASIENAGGRAVPDVLALFDSGSSVTLIDLETATGLGLVWEPATLSLEGLGGVRLDLDLKGEFKAELQVRAQEQQGRVAVYDVKQGFVVDKLDRDINTLLGADVIRDNPNNNVAALALTRRVLDRGLDQEQGARVEGTALGGPGTVPLGLELDDEGRPEDEDTFQMVIGAEEDEVPAPVVVPRNVELSKEQRLDLAMQTIEGTPRSPTWLARLRAGLEPIADVFTNNDIGTRWRVPEVEDPPQDVEGIERAGRRFQPRFLPAHVLAFVVTLVTALCMAGALVQDDSVLAYGHLSGVPKPDSGVTSLVGGNWATARIPDAGETDFGPTIRYGALPVVALPLLQTLRGWRPINDVSGINDYWKPLAPTELTPEEVLFRLGGGLQGGGGPAVVGTADLVSMFTCIPVAASTARYLGVLIEGRPFRYNVLPQGWLNAPFHAQVALRHILGSLYQTKVLAKADDLLFFGRTEEEYLEHLLETFMRLYRAGAQISLHKLKLASFNRKAVWNGLCITGARLKRDRRGVDALRAWLSEPPKNMADLQKLIGVLGWFELGLPGYGSTLRTLRDLLARGVQLSKGRSMRAACLRRVKLAQVGGWTEEHQDALERLVEGIVNGGELHAPEKDKVIHIYSDASVLGYGWVALQCAPATAELDYAQRGYMLVGCGHRAWSGPQSRWATLDQEAYGVLTAVEENAHLVYRQAGSPRTVVYCDHTNVTKVFAPGYATTRAQRVRLVGWTTTMAQYKSFFDLKAVPGEMNVAADFLSRNFGVQPAAGEQARLYALQVAEYALWGRDAGFAAPTAAEISAVSSPRDKPDEMLDWDKTLKLWVRKNTGQVYIPEGNGLRERLMVEIHHGMAHQGLDSGLATLKDIAWWPTWRADFKELYSKCVHCKAARNGVEIRRPLGTPEHGERPGEVWVVDNKELGPSGRFTALAVHIDEFSGYCDLVPLERQGGADQAAALEMVIARYSVPRLVLHDGGPSLRSQAMDLLEEQYGFQRHTTTAYHPQGHGRVENVIGRIHEMLKALCSEHQVTIEHWARFVPQVQLALNTTPTRSLLGHSPYTVFNGGRKPVIPAKRLLHASGGGMGPMKEPSGWQQLVEDAQAAATALWGEVGATREKQRAERRSRYNAQYRPKPLMATPGSYVMVLQKQHSKLDLAWRGPARVVRQEDPLHLTVAFLNQPDQLVQVLASRCAFYHDADLVETPDLLRYARFLTPHYDVEAILGLDRKPDGFYFLVKWVGYTNPTYTNARMLYDDVPTLVIDFLDAMSADRNRTKRRQAQQVRQLLGVAQAAEPE